MCVCGDSVCMSVCGGGLVCQCVGGCVCVCVRERERENSNSKILFSKDCSLGSFRPV